MAFFNSDYKRYVGGLCVAIAVVSLAVFASDMTIFGASVFALLANGYPQAFSVSVALLLFAALFGYIGFLLLRSHSAALAVPSKDTALSPSIASK
jgi:uncharacterized membrane protein